MSDETNNESMTTITISRHTKELLFKEKAHSKETYDTVIRELLAKTQAQKMLEAEECSSTEEPV